MIRVRSSGKYALAILFLLCAASFGAQPGPVVAGPDTYYVDGVSGSDSNAGTSPSQPWRTLSRVERQAYGPGDTIRFHAGQVWDGGLKIMDAGVDGAPITYTAYGSGDKPVFRLPADGRNGAVIVQADSIVLDGLMVRESHENGIIIWQADHVLVQNCEVTDVGIGISVFGAYNQILDNYIHDLNMVENTPFSDNDDRGAVAVALFDSHNEISYNRMINCIAESFDYGTDGGAVELYGDAAHGQVVSDNYIHHNWAKNTDGFVEIGNCSAADNTVAYNVSIDNRGFSFLHLSGQFASGVSNLRIENNTIVDTRGEDWEDRVFGFVGDPGPDTMLVRNNIVYVEKYQTIARTGAFTHDHNVYWMLNVGSVVGFALGPDEVLADPQFASVPGRDFHLTAGSPAIDAGTDLAYPLDYDGNAVPTRYRPSIGAYEYLGPAPSPTATRTLDKHTYLPLVS